MLSDLASEVLKVTETQSAHFALEKTVMEKSCFLTVEWPIQRFSIRIHNNMCPVALLLINVTTTPPRLRLPPSVGRLKPTADARNVVGPTWVR